MDTIVMTAKEFVSSGLHPNVRNPFGAYRFGERHPECILRDGRRVLFIRPKIESLLAGGDGAARRMPSGGFSDALAEACGESRNAALEEAANQAASFGCLCDVDSPLRCYPCEIAAAIRALKGE